MDGFVEKIPSFEMDDDWGYPPWLNPMDFRMVQGGAPPFIIGWNNPMKTRDITHQQKPQWNWTYVHQLS